MHLSMKGPCSYGATRTITSRDTIRHNCQRIMENRYYPSQLPTYYGEQVGTIIARKYLMKIGQPRPLFVYFNYF